MQNQNIRVRIQKNAKNLRFISRDQMFQKNRKNQKQQLSYLKTLPSQQRQLILLSLTSTIPQPLPPLSPTSISFYRRANMACFKTHVQQSLQIHPHLCYQSLFMLAGVQQMNFPSYQSIVKQFQSQLQKYILSPYPQIRQMSMIAAGNKIIGRQKQIQQIVTLDPKQLWVMINHIYQRKISSSLIFPYIGQHNQIVYKSLFEMTNTNDDDIIQLIMSDDNVLEVLVASLAHYVPDIKKYTIRIFGNIMAEKQQYVYDLAKHDILNHFYPFLSSSDEQLRKDACWAISNFVFQKVPSTNLLYNTKLTQKLLHMLQTQWDTKIKIQLCHIFSNLVAFADKPEVLKVITTGRLLQRCGQFLQIDDPQLIHVSLYLINKIVQLGDHFADQDGNAFANQIKIKGIKGKIIQKTYYTENSQISKLSSELQEKLEEEY